MATVRYTTVDGEVLSENRAGVLRDYVPDSLGSTRALLDDSQAITDTWNYWPYGEVQAHTGSSAPPFTFVGTIGYYSGGSGGVYVRTRWYLGFAAAWNSVDLLWPSHDPYSYVSARPVSLIDPSGTEDSKPQKERTFSQKFENVISCGCYERFYWCIEAANAFNKSYGYDRINALGHCMTACCIKRHHPYCTWYWSLRESGRWAGDVGSCMDFWNNRVGYGCAGGKKSCYQCCLDKVDSLTWLVPEPHNWPPPTGCPISNGSTVSNEDRIVPVGVVKGYHSGNDKWK